VSQRTSGRDPARDSAARQRTAQQRLADQRAANAADRAAAARRKKMFTAVIPVVVVLVIVAALIVVKVTSGGTSPKSGAAASTAADAVISKVTGVASSVSEAVGVGTAQAVPVAVSDAPALTVNGLPGVLFVGDEWCPYCATERWALVVALSRFGAFSGLGETTSSPSDVYPNTATLTFYGSTFTGNVVAFSPYELQSNQVVNGQYTTLQTLSAADEALVAKYDAPPYFSSSKAVPFIDIGGKYLISGASYDPQVLQGKTQQQIADALSDPTSPITKGIVGAANLITAAICSITSNAPAAVCQSSWVTAAAAKLASAKAG
jgi:Domain of unknown function (DUF929)